MDFWSAVGLTALLVLGLAIKVKEFG